MKSNQSPEDKDAICEAALASLQKEAPQREKEERALVGYRCRSCNRRFPIDKVRQTGALKLEYCPKCGGYCDSVYRTELRPTTCERCREPFLYRWVAGRSIERAVPERCGACLLTVRGQSLIAEGQKKIAQGGKRRAQQRAAVARHKPKEELSE